MVEHSFKKRIRKIIIPLLILISIFAFFFFPSFNPTGKVIFGIHTIYNPNETLRGDVSISLKEGELIPANSLVTIINNDKGYEYVLSNLIGDDSVEGEFYAEGISLSGSGSGYGIPGKLKPESAKFVMRILKDKSEPTEEKSEESVSTQQEAEEENEEESGLASEEESNLTIEGEIEVAEKVEATEGVTGEELEKEESQIESGEESGEKSVEEKVKEEQGEGGSLITGGVIAEFVVEVEGKTFRGNPFVYELKEGEYAEIISSDGNVTISIEGTNAIVSLDDSIIQEGFGEDYLGDEIAYTFKINLSSLNLKIEEGELLVKISHLGEEIASVSTTISVNYPGGRVENRTELSNTTYIPENLEDYSLTTEEELILKTETGDTKASITKSEVLDNRLIIRFSLGSFWAENSYDYSTSEDEINFQIELDRARFAKRLSKSLLSSESEGENVDKFLGADNLLSGVILEEAPLE